ncbi:MAG: ATP-binding cassette domain-containing protein [Eubacteriales bacterium]|nr:ATP-binding cassette domain-containing protein [Eubacteriales bacterium]
MLRINQVDLYLKKDLRYLIRDFSFVAGDRHNKIALIGEEGNGKSSLLKAIYKPELVQDYLEIKGEISSGGEVLAYLPQTVSEAKARKSTEEILIEEIGWEKLDFTELNRLMRDFELAADLISAELKFAQLSGGEKIKYNLVIELLKEPSILLLDEPSNDLDLESVLFLERFIKDSPLKIIFISHDEKLLKNCADTIIHIEQLIHKTRPVHTVASLGYEAYIKERSRRIERQTRMAAKEREEYEAQMDRYRQIYSRVQHELRTVSRQSPQVARNLKDKMHSVKSMGRRFEREKEKLGQKPIVEAAIDLSFSPEARIHKSKAIVEYRAKELKVGSKVLSRNLSLDIFGPEKICLIGANGSGKTCLIREIMRELKAKDLQIGYMPQDYAEAMDFEQSPVEFLARDYSKEENTKNRTYLGSLKFTAEEMLRPIGELSGGQMAKLYFAKLILHQAEFLILDEPTRNLSPLSGPEIRAALRDFKGGILAVSHDRAFIEEIFTDVYELSESGLKAVEVN